VKSIVPIEIIDVPGYDSTIESHRTMAREAIKTADAFILPHSGYQPSIVQDGRRLINDIGSLGGVNISEKGFAIITKVDRHNTIEDGNKSYKDAKADLMRLANISESHIFVGCVALELLQTKAKNEKLSYAETTELGDLEHTVKTKFPFLKDGVAKAKSTLLKYMADDLPEVRRKEAVDLGSDLEKCLNRILKTINKGTLPMQSDSHIKWGLKWKEIWTQSTKTAHSWRWEHITNVREEFFLKLVQEFKQDLENNISKEDAIAYNLDRQVPYYKALFGYVDVPKIEGLERERLFKVHIARSQSSSALIARGIYSKLQEFQIALFESIGIQTEDEELAEQIFSIDNIIPLSECVAQVESLVMRVAYPVGVALLQWPHTHPNRKPSQQELTRVCPEVVITDSNDDS